MKALTTPAMSISVEFYVLDKAAPKSFTLLSYADFGKMNE